jgi:hypothetical protein
MLIEHDKHYIATVKDKQPSKFCPAMGEQIKVKAIFKGATEWQFFVKKYPFFIKEKSLILEREISEKQFKE